MAHIEPTDTIKTEARLKVQFKDVSDALGIGDMSNESISKMSVYAGSHIHGAIAEKEKKDKKAMADAILDALQDQIDGLRADNAYMAQQNEAIGNALSDLEDGASLSDITNRDSIKQAAEDYKKRTGKDVDMTDRAAVTQMLLDQSKYNRHQTGVNNEKIREATAEMNTLNPAKDNVAKIQELQIKNSMNDEALMKASTGAQHTQVQIDGLVASGANRDDANEVTSGLGGETVGQKNTETFTAGNSLQALPLDSMFGSVAAKVDDKPLTNVKLSGQFETAANQERLNATPEVAHIATREVAMSPD